MQRLVEAFLGGCLILTILSFTFVICRVSKTFWLVQIVYTGVRGEAGCLPIRCLVARSLALPVHLSVYPWARY